jgi:hypothetical protein
MVIWYIFARFGMLYQKKSGHPAPVFRQSIGDVSYGQGDQIGRIFAIWAFVFPWAFFEKLD